MIHWESANIGQCIMCQGPQHLPDTKYFCMNCKKSCSAIDITGNALKAKPGQLFLMNYKSDCCNADITFESRLTCSPKCQDAFVEELENTFGKYKQVVSIENGLTYRVPTKDIIEKGLTYDELLKYPLWVEELT